MAKDSEITKEVLDLVYSGNYSIKQQINDGAEEEYEGCEHNLYMLLESGHAKVSVLGETDSHAREGVKTYCVKFSTFVGKATLYIWERE